MAITPVILSNIYSSNTFGDLIRATDNSINSLNNIAFQDWIKPTGTLILAEPTFGKAGLRSDAIALFKNQTRVEGTGSSLYVQNNAEVATTLYLTNTNTAIPSLYATGNSFINVLSVYSTGEALNVTGNTTFTTNVSVFGTANINYTASETLLVKNDGTIAGNTITKFLQANNRVNTAFVSSDSISTYTLNSNTAISTNQLVSNFIKSNTSISTDKLVSDTFRSNTAISSNTITSTVIVANTAISTYKLVSDTFRSNTAISSNTITSEVLFANTSISTDRFVSNIIKSNTAISSNTITANVLFANTSISTDKLVSDTFRSNTAISTDKLVSDTFRSNTAISSNTITSAVIVANTAISSNTITTNSLNSNTSILADRLTANTIRSNTVISSSVLSTVLSSNTAISTDILTASNIQANATINTRALTARTVNSTSIITDSISGNVGIFSYLTTAGMQVIGTVDYNNQNIRLTANTPSWNSSIIGFNTEVIVNRTFDNDANTQQNNYNSNTYVDAALSWSEPQKRWKVVDVANSEPANTTSKTYVNIALEIDKLSSFSNTKSSELITVIPDAVGTGNLVFSTNPTLITPNIGSAFGNALTLSGSLQANTSANTNNLSYAGTFTGGTGVLNVGSGQIYKTSTGLVGIGNTSPTFKLDVYGTVSANTFNSTVANGSVPFTIQSTTLVPNLNADLLDGYDSSYFLGISNAAYNKANSANTIASSAYNNANSAFDKANTASTTASAGFDKANSANTIASSAYDKANSANTIASSAYNTANAAYNTANAAYSTANASYTYASSTANNAYNTANSAWAAANSSYVNASIIANNAYNAANTASNAANASYTYASSTANNAYNTANNAWAGANNAYKFASSTANNAYNTANVAWVTANTSYIYASSTANNAYNTANAAWAAANAAGSSSNLIAAYNTANLAYSTANASYKYASSTANNAYNTANAAWAAANSAGSFATVVNAYNTANAAWAAANTANTNASNASFVSTGVLRIPYGGTNSTSFHSNTMVFFDGNRLASKNTIDNATIDVTHDSAIILASTNKTIDVWSGPLEIREVNRVGYFTSTSSSISGTTLTVGGSITGVVNIGAELEGAGITANTVITGYGSGSGGAGTYTVSQSQVIGATAISASSNTRISPAITFHWGSANAAAIRMNHAGHFELRGQDGTQTGAIYRSITANSITSTVANGSAPLKVNSTTLIYNLNADYLDGNNGSYYENLSIAAYGAANTANSYANSTYLKITGGNVSGQITSTKGYREGVVNMGTISANTNLDLSQGNIFNLTLAASNIGFTFTNPPPSATACYITVIIKQDATGNRTYGAFNNSVWTDSVKPILTTTANKTDLLSFFTVDGGSTYFGSFAGANFG